MRFALVNPAWSFVGSAYFGCHEPHLPLELGYAQALLQAQGHEVLLLDAHLFGLSLTQVREQVAAFCPQVTVLTTAPSYLAWRCPPPDLRVPQQTALALQGVGGTLVAVGPHPSITPAFALRQLPVDLVVLGEFEDWLPQLAEVESRDWHQLSSVGYREGQEIRVQGDAHEAELRGLPALRWPSAMLQAHHHQHQRFDAAPLGPGAEMETSRGCPYRCIFCAKERVRGSYRQRPLDVILAELDGLLDEGVEYIYFADDLFMPDRELLTQLAERRCKFGIQTRIDLWDVEMLDLLGSAGCHSLTAGMESVTEEGRRRLDKRCALSTTEMTRLLARARKSVPFVEVSLIAIAEDEPEIVAAWRRIWGSVGVWAESPRPLLPYPGSPEYTRRWGAPDDQAWERAQGAYPGTRRSGRAREDEQARWWPDGERGYSDELPTRGENKWGN